ncbi:unnamed protein product [Sphenostylis stenocarpa]|uniref:Uncharacterized protein n=1 Tax=Sphenostylis stenocarpa TaxID=92480 RepID=A0AA86W143_9FABA|nr:unnamed protein product [Sphenostylis stenocarpa]
MEIWRTLIPLRMFFHDYFSMGPFMKRYYVTLVEVGMAYSTIKKQRQIWENIKHSTIQINIQNSTLDYDGNS